MSTSLLIQGIGAEMHEPKGVSLNEVPTVLREFLYADLDRARSLLAQRLGGVPEESQVTDSVLKHYALGIARYLGTGREAKSEEYEQRSLLDALFPALEELLESEQWLTDISEEIDDPADPHLTQLQERLAPGSIVRLTAPAHLFDAEYVAHTFAATSAAIDGLSKFQPQANASSTPPKRKPNPSARVAKPTPGRSGHVTNLEDVIDEFSTAMLGDVVTADTFRAFVKTSRGIFPTGLHLLMGADRLGGWTVSARLQKNQRYLDAETDVLFSRYGVSPLPWTIVGTIGHYAPASAPNDLGQIPIVRADQTIDRTGFIKLVNGLMTLMAAQGLSSSPTHPGFSIVPLAVYRTIPIAPQT